MPIPVWNFPAPHSEQLYMDGIPVPVWKVPIGHLRQDVSTAIMPHPVWYVPALHGSQADFLTDAAVVPGLHGVQFNAVCIPSPLWYLPVPQEEQLDVSLTIPLPV